MASIGYQKQGSTVVLRVDGVLDGSTAWRVARLAQRFARGARVLLDLSGVERMLGFGASVLAHTLEDAAVAVVAVRPEHRRLLAAEGVLESQVAY